MTGFNGFSLRIREYDPFILAPTPPQGSDFDQSTLNYEADTAWAVAGEVGGDPAVECYTNQGFKNQRDACTGFGIIGGYLGNVTEPMVVGIATDGQRKANPQDPNQWIGAVNVDPAQLNPDTYYYLEAIVTADPIILPDETIYLICATNEPATGENESYNGWAILGMSTAPYQHPFDVFDGTDWYVKTFDAMFWTYSSLGGADCSTYTDSANCVAAGCYWCDGICQSSPCGTVCSDYTTETACINAGCYWYGGSCHSTPQQSTCEGYTTQSECIANDCHWYAYPNPFGQASCHSQDQMMAYLPFIIAGVGGLIVIIAIARR